MGNAFGSSSASKEACVPGSASKAQTSESSGQGKDVGEKKNGIVPPLQLKQAQSASTRQENIVVVEFMKRKLAFVFPDSSSSQLFLLCMELLIRKAQQRMRKVAAGAKRSSAGGA